MVSEEVKMLQRDLPKSEADSNTPQPSGASKEVNSEAVGKSARGGQMGQNDSPTQEGPYTQGINPNVRNDVKVTARSSAAKGTDQPVNVEHADEKRGHGIEEPVQSAGTTLADQHILDPESSINLEVEPSFGPLYKRDASTIVANNFEGVIEEHLSAVSDAGISEDNRATSQLARKLWSRQFVRFESPEEKAETLEMVKRMMPKRKDSAVKKPSFQPLPEKLRNGLIEQMVAGRYHQEELLNGKKVFQQSVLNNIARATTLNGTYLRADGDRLMAKVRSLLPAARTAKAPPPLPQQKAQV